MSESEALSVFGQTNGTMSQRLVQFAQLVEAAALAEPVQEPQTLIDPAEYDDFEAAIRHNERIKTRRYDPVKPMAMETIYETIIHWDEGGGKRSRRELARRIVDLYTAPPQRKPLTDEEIWKFYWSRPEVPDGEDDSMEAEFVAAVRRVLAAHGIGSKT